jgi:raffinose/stachyose/melibiose transport system substrate-binding protein
MVENGYFQPGFIGMGPDEARQIFMDGKAAMYFMGQWDGPMLISDQSAVADKVDAFVIPAKYPENNNISVGSADFAFAVTESCENKDAAVAFLKYWSSPDVEKQFLYEEGRTPAAKFDIDESKLDPLFVKILQISNSQAGLTPWYDRAFGAGEGTEFNNSAVAISGGDDPQEIFDALQQFAEDNADR